MGQDNFYEFTTLILPVLLFGEVIINMISLRDASASPHHTPLLFKRFLSFVPVVSRCSIWTLFPVFFSFTDRGSLKEVSMIRISLAEN